MNSSKRDILTTNLFQACNDEVRNGVIIDQAKAEDASKQNLYVGDSAIAGKKDEEIYKNRGQAIPPDEILDRLNSTKLKIPMVYREEFPDDLNLPSSDLLKALHYYTSTKISMSDDLTRMKRSMNDTALLAFGLLIEDWADTILDSGVADMFMEEDTTDEHQDSVASEEDYSSSSNSESSYYST
ncbi:Piso0_004922 [Millerozyma farinosa CBS 7064]|uniref:Piso0_004922 protein n=1 Tax=Pichia sorbitophila (strain ATCC MYA-4447 / BCRC 22081 / CBS 7064 / NBRC 10061 / NRRL Y-12695) TaxID=559304 RepID=G8Y3R6_PICSO|nr:Piso0_004922 [Millerozyma farinosa CBS 7064]